MEILDNCMAGFIILSFLAVVGWDFPAGGRLAAEYVGMTGA
jgi:hypothetical protein